MKYNPQRRQITMGDLADLASSFDPNLTLLFTSEDKDDKDFCFITGFCDPGNTPWCGNDEYAKNNSLIIIQDHCLVSDYERLGADAFIVQGSTNVMELHEKMKEFNKSKIEIHLDNIL